MQTEDQAIRAMVQSRYFVAGRSLNLWRSKKQWQKALESQDFTHLLKLDLSMCGIDDESIQTLASKIWPSLAQLKLQNNKITSKGLKILIDTQFGNMQFLYLTGNNIKSDCKKYLNKLRLPKLVDIQLSDSFLQNEGVKHMTKSYWPVLASLSIYNCQIKLDSYLHLPQMPMKRLKKIQTSDLNALNNTYYSLQAINPRVELNLTDCANNRIKQTLFQLRYSILLK